jgi:hypothetical protein
VPNEARNNIENRILHGARVLHPAGCAYRPANSQFVLGSWLPAGGWWSHIERPMDGWSREAGGGKKPSRPHTITKLEIYTLLHIAPAKICMSLQCKQHKVEVILPRVQDC